MNEARLSGEDAAKIERFPNSQAGANSNGATSGTGKQ